MPAKRTRTDNREPALMHDVVAFPSEAIRRQISDQTPGIVVRLLGDDHLYAFQLANAKWSVQGGAVVIDNGVGRTIVLPLQRIRSLQDDARREA